MPLETLIIAYGNPLRGDDGVGPTAAQVVDSWRLPGVRVVIVHQLAPELIDAMKQAGRVLFVDADCSGSEKAYAVREVEPKKSRHLLGHWESPASLLALLSELENRTPKAWLLTISGSAFEHGPQLSEAASTHLKTALLWIRGWLE